MDDTFGNCVAFDPKENFPFSLPDGDNLSDFGQVAEIKLKFINLMDVVTHDNNWRQSRHGEYLGLKPHAKCS